MTNTEIIQAIKAEIERQMNFYDGKEREVLDDPKQFTYALFYQGRQRMCAELLSFLSTLESEKPMSQDKELEEEIDRYFEPLHPVDIQEEPFTQMDKCARHFAEWQKEQIMKIITKDYNLEEAGAQYVKTYFRDIDWTPDVIKSCLEEAFISGGEYVFKKIKYE